MFYHKARLISVAIAAAVFAGCASTKSIPMTVNSDPLGAQVLYQIKGPESTQSDWIYIGNTPLSAQRRLSTKVLNDKHTIVLRVMKEGFVDQTKELSGTNIRKTASDGERVFWNSIMIKGGN